MPDKIDYLKVEGGTLVFNYFQETKGRWEFWKWWFRKSYSSLSVDVLTLFDDPPPPDYAASIISLYIRPRLEGANLDHVRVYFWVRNSKGIYYDIPMITVVDKRRKSVVPFFR